MKRLIKKTKFLTFALFVLLISIGMVCAQENTTANDVDEVESPILSQNQADEVLSDGEVGTFAELSNLISSSPSGSTINLTKDYKRLSSEGYSYGITIGKKLTINGNGHTIDASNGARIFSVTGSNVVLNNITLTHASGDVGVGIYASGDNFKVYNSIFKNIKGAGASALYIVGQSSNVVNCAFIDNEATNQYAAALFLQGHYGKIINSTFTHNVANTYSSQMYNDGGAVYIYGKYATIDGCNFTNNIQKRTGGGALYCGGTNGVIKNCNFINNSAPSSHGGGASILGGGWTIFNNVFVNNTASNTGGGLYYNAQSGKLYNLTFINNTAHMGGGAHLAFDYYQRTDINDAGSTLSDSKFINNHAIYGGGAVNAISHFIVKNCEFINNSANNYGGAVSVGYSSIDNSRFINNTASFGGGVFSYASKISNSNFTDNHANAGNSIYVVTESSLINNNGDDDAFSKPAVPGGQITGSHEVQHMLQTKNGYYGFCSELYNGNPYTGVYDDSIDFIKNAINGQPVKEYLKILIYRFLDNFDDLKRTGFHNYVWAFTDHEYWNSKDPIVQNVIELYDSGFRVPSVNACKVLSNGTLMYINFSSMVTPSSQQNLFLFKFAYGEEVNQVFTKEALINKTIYIGDSVEYRLVINNKGNLPVYDNWVEDKEHSDGLTYQSWRAESGNWTYNEQLHRWYLDVLEPGKSASVILTFGVTLEGLLINNAITGLGDVNVTNSAAGFESFNPNMTVEKRTITPQVDLGNQTMFDIIVTNTGDVDLDNVFVCESEYGSGLVYVDYISKQGTWKHSINKEGKHVFTLDGLLEQEEFASFRVIFKTVKAGNFTNTVTAGFNDTVVSNSTNTTEVIGNDTPDTPDNKTDKTTDEKPINKTDVTKISKNITSDVDDVRKTVLKPPIDEKATGNPLLALILALMLIPLRRFKK